MRYVLTYIPRGDQVLMIRKNRPDWQAGKLNFPGGHVEEGEDPGCAAARELFEETSLLAKHLPFQGQIIVKEHVIDVFMGVHTSGVPQQKTDESLLWVNHEYLRDRDDLVDRNIVIMSSLIRSQLIPWELVHTDSGYKIHIPDDMTFDKHK